MRQKNSGFVLMVSLLLLAGLATLTSVGLMRSTTELVAANRYVDTHQAFHLAEAGADEVLWEFVHSGGDFKTGTPPDVPGGEGWVDLPAGPECPVGRCVRQTLLLGGGQTQVTVSDTTGSQPVMQVTGTAGSASRRLQVSVRRNPKLPILGTTTVVGQPDPDPADGNDEEAMFDPGVDKFFSGNPTLTIDGCDAVAGGPCTHALTFTTDAMYNWFVDYVKTEVSPELLYADRLVGLPSDHPDWAPLGSPPRYYYSVHSAPQDIANGGLGYDRLNELADWAKAQTDPALGGNGCYITTANDDTDATDHVELNNRTLGTEAQPKLCYVEAPFLKHPDGTYQFPSDSSPDSKNEEVYVEGPISGWGVLVVRGEFDVNAGTVDYNGIIISMGPSGEFEFENNTNIHGAVIVSTSEPSYDTQGGPRKWHKSEIELHNSGTITYDSDKVAMAESLLAGWTPPGGGGSSSPVTIEAWQDMD